MSACCRVAETGGVKQRMRAKAARALVRYTQSAIEDLKGDEDEMLRGDHATRHCRGWCWLALLRKPLARI